MIRLATVSPCYNEEEALTTSVQRLTALFDNLVADQQITPDSMMLFVNDGSTDRSWSIIEQLQQSNHYVCGINLSRNSGHQNAIMAGMMTARHWADAVITIDADLQDDLAAIPLMLQELAAGNEVVYGVKVSRTADPLLKRLSAEAFYHLQRSMGVDSVFNHADFRLLSRRALDMLAQYGESNIYLRGLIPLLGLPSATVDDVISERTAGKSKYNISRMMGLALDGITSFSIKPLYIITYTGMLFLFVSVLIGIYVIHALIAGTAVPGWASLILSIWLVGGFVLIGIGVAGIYIGKIYNEVKRRPLYHIKDLLLQDGNKLD
ncbi:MAG: glycosyltransferase family 2 protein [Bacteroidaceae bacterium]|nr:glycosyltransferase family 2 protein [Bacteroidaceae bacterium]